MFEISSKSNKVNNIMLRPYQKEAMEAIFREWEQGHKRTLLQLATGMGKTVVFASIAAIQRKKGRKQLFLAHREELIMQGAKTVEKITGKKVDIILGSKTTATKKSKMVFASVASLSRDNRLNMYPEDYFDDIYVDEAHHSTADTYQKILRHFPNANVLGVTATPTRSDEKALSHYYQSMAYRYSLVDGIKDGYLSPIVIKQIPLKIDISEVHLQNGDYSAGELGDTLQFYFERIADEIEKIVKAGKRKHIVIFTPLVKNSVALAEILKSKGIKAEEINGNSDNRNELLEKFKAGDINVLVNALLLTEGWDCPQVDCIILLRPTKSETLFLQAVGRGTRLCEGKKDLLLLDFLWITKNRDMFNAVSLVAENDEELGRMRAALKKTRKEVNLLDLQKDVQQKLLEELEENAKKKASITKINSKGITSKEIPEKKTDNNRKITDSKKQYALYALSRIFDSYHIAVYQENYAWESLKPTEAQIRFFTNNNLSQYTGPMTRGSASAVISVAMKRMETDLCTIKQSAYLFVLGHPNPGRVKYKDAGKTIEEYKRKKKKK